LVFIEFRDILLAASVFSSDDNLLLRRGQRSISRDVQPVLLPALHLLSDPLPALRDPDDVEARAIH
jgi:hypothetical protein